MPPSAKFTREQIIEAAFALVTEKGVDSLTARALGDKLGSSARPIFTVFNNMDEVRYEVCKSAVCLYNGYVENGLKEAPAFKGVGKQYILFAMQHPKIFELLFMHKQQKIPNLKNVLNEIDENYPAILSSIKNAYGVDEQTAKLLYQHLWIYSHGIATLCATGMCAFTGEEISEMLTQVFVSLLKNIKSGGNND